MRHVHPLVRGQGYLLVSFLPTLLPAQALTRGPSVWEHGSTSFLAGTNFFFQGLTLNGPSLSMQLTDLLYSRVR